MVVAIILVTSVVIFQVWVKDVLHLVVNSNLHSTVYITIHATIKLQLLLDHYLEEEI